MTAHIIRGNALALPLADSSVDLIVTSPPYFALRSYTDGGEHYAGQIGSEPTPGEFLDALIAATREMVRVLKPGGSIFVNLGDKYVATSNGSYAHRNASRDRNHTIARSSRGHGIPTKSLMGLPWRYALRCIDELGLILRAEIVWGKPNGLPESVTDRVRRSHEQWFHFTVQPRYFAAVDEVREPHSGGSHHARKDKGVSPRNARITAAGEHGLRKSNTDPSLFDPRGKLPGSVWDIPSQPLNIPPEVSHQRCCGGKPRPGCEDGIDHFAAFPMEWPRRIIQGWSPNGICTACGEGRRPVGRAEYDNQGRTTNGPRNELRRPANALSIASGVRSVRSTTITGYTCACPTPTAPTRPAVVLDPFGGTGTTALVAKVLGRTGISVDMSADYCDVIARWRINDPGEIARALQVEKPQPVHRDQMDLFSEETTHA